MRRAFRADSARATALGGLSVVAALLALGRPDREPNPARRSVVLASVPAPPARPACALLADTGTRDAPRLSGLALPGTGIEAYLTSYGGASRIGKGVTAVNPAFCPVLDAIAPFVTLQPNGPLRPRIEPRVPVGTTARPAPPAPAGVFLTLDLFSAKGQVVHLLPPGPGHPQAAWTAEPPTGQWLAVTLASERPLLEASPSSESASSYLRVLATALRDRRGVTADAVQIDVVAAAARDEAVRRPGCEAVAAINERAQTEGLSDDDKAVLRACHR